MSREATGRRRRPGAVLPWGAVLLGILYFTARLWGQWLPPWFPQFPDDFAIDWTAAVGWRAGISLYDASALRPLGLRLIDNPEMSRLFLSQFTAYINPPTTALIALPFTACPFAASVVLYRAALALGFAAAVALGGLALPRVARGRGWTVGALAAALLFPVLLSVQLGQVDAWVTLALAGSIWAAGRGRWGLAGGAAGVATLLKISPGLLLAYFVLRGKWPAAVGAGLALTGTLGLSALAGLPGDAAALAELAGPGDRLVHLAAALVLVSLSRRAEEELVAASGGTS